MAKNLVIYYSRRGQNYVGGSVRELERGNAEQLAEFIRDACGADLFEIETVKPYSEDYMKCTEEAKAELAVNARPKLKAYLADISEYDNIFICGPCWWGTYPMAVYSQLERLNFRGKRVLPVMTHEGSGFGSAERDLRKACPGASFARGLAVQGGMVPGARDQVEKWVKRNLK
ncbi:MAG: NAD(P)H-dependent oxidoreductase [Mogibacterium sp.]|nr:NAD(P)H-dependent oxidoreductase [Mogibacterium sp.]